MVVQRSWDNRIWRGSFSGMGIVWADPQFHLLYAPCSCSFDGGLVSFAAMTVHDVAGDLVAVVHAGFAVFVLGGFFLIVPGELLGWGWVRNGWFRYAHLGAAVFTAVRVWLGMTCPLWILEDWVRGSSVPVYDGLTQACHRLCFRGAPQRGFRIKATVFAALVLGQMILTTALQRRAASRIPVRTGQGETAVGAGEAGNLR